MICCKEISRKANLSVVLSLTLVFERETKRWEKSILIPISPTLISYINFSPSSRIM